MILVIAEKPSLGRDIAQALPGEARNGKRYIEKGNYIVTWVFGHMLTLKEPEDYSESYKKWSLSSLPIYFDDWGQKIGEDSGGYETKAQRVELIGELLEKSESVIHAGDPDEEGQLLIDELLEWFDYKKPVMRLNTSDTTMGGLKKALSKMEDNGKYINEGKSAYARSVADLMVGVNMSRFFTCTNSGVLLTVGRVQTPTLGLVVNRDIQIEEHKKQVYYDIYVQLETETEKGKKNIRAKYQTKKAKKDEEQQLITDRDEAGQILKSLTGRTFDKTVIERKTVNEDPPLPFNLVKLQSYCSTHFSYNPEEVMEITQTLREKHKAITYNRSDCRYLSEEHFKEAPKTMAQVIKNIGFKPAELDMKIHSKCFNDKNITAHFAIIPTNNRVDLDKLTEREKNVYLAVCKYYMAQFMPKAIKEKSKLTIELDSEHSLGATSSKTIKPGYLSIFKDIKKDEPSELSDIEPGVYVSFAREGEIEEKETKPPSRYTKATLNEDMTRIARYVTDPEAKRMLIEKDKDKLGENGSIGTSATRSSIIDGLVKKGYIEQQGKRLISTKLGRELYRILPDEIKKADMTAKWWSIQEDIRSGEKTYKALTQSVLEVIENVLKNTYPPIDQSVMTKTVTEKYHTIIGKCPLCGGNVIEGQKGFGCSNWKPPMSCKFVIWKNYQKGMFKNTEITPETAKKLLAGKKVRMSKLVSAKGEKFDALVELKTNREAQYPVSLEIAENIVGTCPKCGGNVTETMKAFSCSCGFAIWKKQERGLFRLMTVTDKTARLWLSGERVKCKSLADKNGNKFSAEVSMHCNPKSPYPEYELHFEPPQKTGLVCPRCGKDIVESPRGFYCEGEDCRWQLPKKSKLGMFEDVVFDRELAALLLGDKPVLIENLKSKAGNTFKANVTLDDSQRSDYGPSLRVDFKNHDGVSLLGAESVENEGNKGETAVFDENSKG
ncbi:MAG: DNA topoisomerase [Clostridiales bacterium]|nr:DNA topoisomerase [Clostridiales bacterium]